MSLGRSFHLCGPKCGKVQKPLGFAAEALELSMLVTKEWRREHCQLRQLEPSQALFGWLVC